ncbi:MAG TPA: transketolase [Longimicrobiales bacterium]|nr:transketolase [Longimicrobiales bacterium]
MARSAAPSAAPDVDALRDRARIVRRHIVEMLHEAASGHPGGSLSAVEIVTALYFGGVLRHDPENPEWPDRDRFVLSKGHGVPVQYAALAMAGYFPIDELSTLRKIDSRLQGHPVLGTAPGIEASTGSLGQGLSIGLGMALAARLDANDYRVFVLLGDGECQEGQVWEAAMAAGHHRPDNLIAIVDYNKFQLDGATADIIGLEPLAAKWESMGWKTREIDGHDMRQVLDALQWSMSAGEPACIIAHTVKGKGVSFMEGENAYHGVAPSDDELARALGELDGEDPEEQHAHALGSDHVLEEAEKSIDAESQANGKGGAR